MSVATFTAMLAMGALAWASGPATTTHNAAPARKAPAATVRKTAARPATARRTGSATASAKHTTSRRAPMVHTSWRTRQTSPSADRYREIQEALVARGYLSAGDATGTWGASSTDALKRFQAEQTLDSTGKIDSLSLIALGLGPKHDSSVALPRIADTGVQPEAGRN